MKTGRKPLQADVDTVRVTFRLPESTLIELRKSTPKHQSISERIRDIIEQSLRQKPNKYASG